jgi:hypothetical protein
MEPQLSPGKSQPTSGALLKCATFGTALALLSGCTKFGDTPGGGKENFGRTVNGFSTMLAGIITQAVATNATANFTVVKPGWADSTLTVTTTSSSIKSSADLALASCNFDATGSKGGMKGEIHKSEFNWTAEETGPGTWAVKRFGWKANYTLTYTINNGAISGVLQRPLDYDWTFDGTYRDGQLNLNIHTGFTEPNFQIQGKVEK